MDERRASGDPRTSQAEPKVSQIERDGVDAAVARWQSQLLQLNRSNNLLYFKGNTAPKDPKSGRRATIRCVPINQFTPDGIDDYLQRSRRGRTFDYARRRRRRGTKLEPAAEPVDADADIEFVRGDLSTDVEPLALQRVLLRFLRKEREWMEEQGINVLFLAAGFLEWIDEDRERAKAPLLLLPVDLQRASPGDPFVLSREDDDASANATLRYKLRQFDITLPEFNHETYAAYLQEVRNSVAERDDWKVTQEVVLSTFQYTKLAMWEDLDQMRSVGVTHPMVRRLAGEGVALDFDGAALRNEFPADSELAGGQLDDILDLRQEIAILPADHSQLRAVAAARVGDNLVIHGPPGTGKSQTIVNIISNLLAHGKRVLFVSEKSVALDVVKDRLDQEDLGVFCLDMHSDRASKTSVYEQLRSSIEDSGHVAQFDYGFAELEASRKTLNEVARALHEPRASLERSVFQVHGEYAQLRDLSDVEFDVTHIKSVGESQLRSIDALTERIARRPDEFKELTTSKWRFLKTRSSSVGLADRLRRDAIGVERVVNSASTQLREVAELLGVRAPATFEEASSLSALARHLDSKPLVFRHWLSKETLGKLRRVAVEQREQQQQARMLAKQTEEAFGGRAPVADYQQLSRSVRPTHTEIGALRQALGPVWSARLMPDPKRILNNARRARVHAVHLVASLDELATKLGTDSTSASWPESSRALGFAREVVTTGIVPDGWLDPNQVTKLKNQADTSHIAHEALVKAEAEISVRFDVEIVGAVDHESLVRLTKGNRIELQRLIGYASLETTESVHAAATALLETLEQLRSLLSADSSPNSWRQTEHVLDFARDQALDLRDMGPVPETWLESDNLEEARLLVQAACAACETLDEAESTLAIVCDIGLVSKVDDESLIYFRTDERVDLQRLIGNASLEATESAYVAATALLETLAQLRSLLGADSSPNSWRQTEHALDFARDLALDLRDMGPVPETWVESDFFEETKRLIEAASAAHESLHHAESNLFEEFDSELVEVVDDHLLHRLRIDHQSSLRRMFGGAWRRDQRLLRGYAKVPRALTVSEALHAVQRALEVQNLRDRWATAYAEVESLLGPYANERETDWRQLRQLADQTARRLSDWPWEQSALRVLLTDVENRQVLRQLSTRADAEYGELQDALRVMPQHRLDREEFGPAGVAATTNQASTALAMLAKYSKAREVLTVKDGIDAVRLALEVRKLRDEWATAYAAVASLLGSYASERESDWCQIQQLVDQTAHQLSNWPWERTALRALLTDAEARQTLRQLSARADAEYRDLQDTLRVMPQHRLDQEELGPTGVADITKQANTVLNILSKYTKKPVPVTVNEGLEAIQRAVAIRKLRKQWDKAYSDIAPHIGQHARLRLTDWAQLKALLSRLEGFLLSWPWEKDQLRTLLTDHTAQGELDSTRQTVGKRLQALEDSLQDLDSDCLDLEEIGPAGIVAAIHEAIPALERLEEATRTVIDELDVTQADWQSFGDLIDDIARLQSIEDDERTSRESLRQDFGEWFRDRNTDWGDVIDAIQWCQVLLDMAGSRPSARLCELVCEESVPFDPTRIAASIESLESEYPRDLEVLDQRFNIAESVWEYWASAPFLELSAWIESVHEDAESASNWIEFKLAADELDRTFGPSTVQRIREASEDAALVPGIVNRRLFGTWLDAVTQQEPPLRDFTGRDHEALRREFQNLDRQLPRVLREEARRTLFERYPKSRTSVTRAGQLGVLRGELTKQRRQMSVRQLLTTAPQLIQALKPCFLMSPLAVSQYMDRTDAASANLHFDTVIFDEASQVLPEDAVPAISRANQAIVVGDRRQLPPTTVFQHRYEHEDDDDDGDDETDWFEGRESILDVMVGMVGSGVAEHYLGVHYRSRHDSLIRYSNHYFYEDRLLTFPSPRKAAAHGVNSVYLPDGRYDAGGSRTNRLEAEKIVELVFELLRTRPPSESIGVVALSRAQTDLIETLIDEAREFYPEYEDRFARERQERFFVKNLENVQGDERDHVFLSVGYGPAESGRIYNRFGPINNEGGERRLNVAVSRARRSMTIVHSLRPEDITSESRGAQLLKRYLEFARNPDTTLVQSPAADARAQTESPFEEAVRRAMIERGHLVDVQVGVAGYRIDLAIQAEDGEGYALGIECDGATYHSAPAARDRDWLRQSVLEGLGWRIHRVWSRAWIQNPQRELDAIERALKEEDSSGIESEDAQNGTQIEVGSDVIDERRPTEVSDEEGAHDEHDGNFQDQVEPNDAVEGNALFDAYREADLTTFRVGQELKLESISRLCELISEVVRVEGPVHRDIVLERVRRRFRASRMRGATRQRFLNAIRRAANVNLLWLPEKEAGAAAQYLFLMDPADAESIAPRAPTSDDTRRRVEHISLAELKAGILVCAELLYGAGRNDLIAETARQFGYRRTGKDIAGRVGKAVDQLIHAGKLTGDDLMLTIADSA